VPQVVLAFMEKVVTSDAMTIKVDFVKKKDIL
jgi:hypothetical protein